MDNYSQSNLIDGKYGIADLVILEELTTLFENFALSTGFSVELLDYPDMHILISGGSREICNQFQSNDPSLETMCIQCNHQLIRQLDINGKSVSATCPIGLVECAAPIVIEGKHIASLTLGQVLLAPANIENFRRQVNLHGWDEDFYLNALQHIPTINEHQFHLIIAFFENMAQLISKIGTTRLETLRDAEKKAAEKQTREAFSILKGTLEAGDNGILVVSNEDNRVLFSNQCFNQMWHIPPNLIAASDKKTILDYVVDQIDDPQQFLHAVKKSYDIPDTRIIGSVNSKDGSIFEYTYFPMLNKADVIGKVWSFRDITAQKQIENKKRESEERLSLALEVSKAGIWELNLKTGHVYFDQRFHAILGYEPGELPNNSDDWLTYHCQDDMANMVANINAYLEGSSAIYESEHRIRTKAGSWAWVLTRGQRVQINKFAEEEVLMGIAINVTERKLVEEELTQYRGHLEKLVNERTSQLSALNQELTAFSYSVSHDLRAPLRRLDGFSNILLEDYGNQLDNTGKDYLMRIRSASQHMGELIDALLKLARISQTELNFEQVNLSELIHGITNNLQQSQPERQVAFAIQEAVIVKGDPNLLSIAMENMLNNAWKFTSYTVNGKIEFGVTVIDGEKVCYIRDNGVGFNMNYIEKLFTPFQRLHSDREFPGSGIGLSTVQRVLQQHGGKIWAESSEGKGATFYFKLQVI